MSKVLIESALRLLLHARNSRGGLRSEIRSLIRRDVKLLRGMS